MVLKKGFSLYLHTKNDDGNGMGRMKCFSYLGGRFVGDFQASSVPLYLVSLPIFCFMFY